MNSTIWYCDDDGCLFPNEEMAREGFRRYCFVQEMEWDEETFRRCYKEISFTDYNKSICSSEDGFFHLTRA